MTTEQVYYAPSRDNACLVGKVRLSASTMRQTSAETSETYYGHKASTKLFLGYWHFEKNKMKKLTAAWNFDTKLTYFIASSSHIQTSYNKIILVDSVILNCDLEWFIYYFFPGRSSETFRLICYFQRNISVEKKKR